MLGVHTGATFTDEVPGAPRVPRVPELSISARRAHADGVLAAAGAFIARHASVRTSQQRHTAEVGEFEGYLNTYCKPGRDTLLHCTDLEIVAFLHDHYVPVNPGRVHSQACGSTLAKVVSELSRAFVE